MNINSVGADRITVCAKNRTVWTSVKNDGAEEVKFDNTDKLVLSDSYRELITAEKTGFQRDAGKTDIRLSGDGLYDYYTGIDFNDFDHTREIGWGCAYGDLHSVPSEGRIAEYFGGIAKEIDTLYSQGKMSDEVYGKLDEWVKDKTEEQLSKTERVAAAYRIVEERMESPSPANSVLSGSKGAKEAISELEKMISDYVEKFFKTDRKAFWKMFGAYRKG